VGQGGESCGSDPETHLGMEYAVERLEMPCGQLNADLSIRDTSETAFKDSKSSYIAR
jgi:hypothetical protein